MILVPFVLVTIAVSIYGFYLPNLYRGSTSLFIEAPKIPADYVKSTVTVDLGGRLRTITQQMTNRAKLLRIIDELKLYPEEVEMGASSEALVGKMKKNIQIIVPNRRDNNLFEVHFIHTNPNLAMLGVTQLVNLFIVENVQIRAQQAEGTTDFMEGQLENLKGVLEKQEADLQAFKRRYMGELPSQLDANLRTLDSYNKQLTNNLDTQRELGNRADLLEEDLSKLRSQSQAALDIEGGLGNVNPTLSQLLSQREALKHEILSMEATFTPLHPDLIARRKALTKVDLRIQNVNKNLRDQNPTEPKTRSIETSSEFGQKLTALNRRIEQNDYQLQTLRNYERDLRGKIRSYQLRVEATPKREQQLTELTRDYNNTQGSYDELLRKKMDAQLSENLEKLNKGEKFLILDKAIVPTRPYLPNRGKILLMGLGGGLGLGIGLALLLEMMFPVFHNLPSLKERLNTPIVIAIPEIVDPHEKKQKRKRYLIGIGAGAGLVIAATFLVDRYIFDLAEITERISENIRNFSL